MKLTHSILGALGGLLLASQSYGYTITDLNDYNSTTGYVSQDHALQDSFNVNALMNIATEDVTSATVSFHLVDQNNIWDKYFSFELAFVSVDGQGIIGTSDSFNLDLQINNVTVSATALADLNADGILKYQVFSTSGDFIVDYAKLTAQVSPAPGGTSVPDGGSTLVLLGLTALGAALFKKALPAGSL